MVKIFNVFIFVYVRTRYLILSPICISPSEVAIPLSKAYAAKKGFIVDPGSNKSVNALFLIESCRYVDLLLGLKLG